MAASVQADKVARHLGLALGQPVELGRLEALHGGACQDNFVVEAQVGGVARRWVLRSDADSSLPGSLHRGQEAQVIARAVAAGVPTPAAHFAASDLVRPGAHAYFLDWVEGVAIGAKVVRDPALAEARKALPKKLMEALGRVHGITDRAGLDLPVPPSTPMGVDPGPAAVAHQKTTLDVLDRPRPALVYALGWLSRNPPKSQEITLVHGDFRVGNFMVTPSGLSAILDWEFAHFGSPLEDLAWLCVRDWRFGQLKLAAGGLTTRAELYRLYTEETGREVDPADVHFWEILGNVRWAIGAWVQGQRFLRGENDLELVAIARRATEMEYEALRLIEVGPPQRGT